MISFIPKKSIGVDIADNSIEVVQLKEVGSKIAVDSFGRVNLQPGIVKNGRIIKEAELAEALRAAFREASPKPIADNKIVFGFPESQTFFHIFSYKFLPDEKVIDKERMDKIILEEAWTNIPIVKNEMVVYYQLLADNRDGIDFLIVAATKRIVFEWQEFFNKLSLDVQSFDIEALANFRSLAVESKKPIGIIDIGTATTNFYIFFRKKIVYEYTIDIGGEDLTAEIVKATGMKEEAAENKKIEFGLSNTEEAFFPALVKILEGISSEVKEALGYFEDSSRMKVEKLFFVGGSSQLKGLPEYFTANLGLPAFLGESKYLDSKKLEFIGAIGMALRGMDKKIDEEDPVIPFVEEGGWDKKQEDCEQLDNNLSIDEKDGEEEKTKSLKKILVLILFIGAIIFGAAFYYRQQEKIKQQAEIKANQAAIDNLSVVQDENISASTTVAEASGANADTIATSSDETTASDAKFVVVEETEVGYLNIREGAGVNFKIVTTVKPGEAYKLLENQGEWSKIQLSPELFGWAASKYLQEKD